MGAVEGESYLIWGALLRNADIRQDIVDELSGRPPVNHQTATADQKLEKDLKGDPKKDEPKQ